MSDAPEPETLMKIGGVAAGAAFVFRYLRDLFPANRRDITRLHERLDAIQDDVGDMRERVARIEGRMDPKKD